MQYKNLHISFCPHKYILGQRVYKLNPQPSHIQLHEDNYKRWQQTFLLNLSFPSHSYTKDKYFHCELLEAYSLKWLQEEKFEAVQLLLEKTEKDLNYEKDWDIIHKIESEIVKRENQEKLKND